MSTGFSVPFASIFVKPIDPSKIDNPNDNWPSDDVFLSPDILKHLIPGLIGPGPFAQSPIPLPLSGTVSREIKRQNTSNGYTFGCHRCGAKDPETSSGVFILDHQFPTALNPQGLLQFGYPHCLPCSNEQGGRVRDLRQKRYGQ